MFVPLEIQCQPVKDGFDMVRILRKERHQVDQKSEDLIQCLQGDTVSCTNTKLLILNGVEIRDEYRNPAYINNLATSTGGGRWAPKNLIFHLRREVSNTWMHERKYTSLVLMTGLPWIDRYGQYFLLGISRWSERGRYGSWVRPYILSNRARTFSPCTGFVYVE